MYHCNIRRTITVTIFYLFVSFNLLTHDSSGIKNKEGGRYFRHRHFRLHYETLQNFLRDDYVTVLDMMVLLNPSVITDAEAHMMYRNIDSSKKAKKESNSGGKRRSMIILEVSLRK